MADIADMQKVEQPPRTGRTALYILLGLGIRKQRSRLNAYCKSRQWAVSGDDVYVDTANESADNTDFDRMVASAEAGEIDRIVSIRSDCVARDMNGFLALVKRLNHASCGLVLVDECLDSATAYGNLMSVMFATMKEGLKVSLGSSGVRLRKEQAYTTRCPYGYKRVDGKIIVDEPAKALVIDVFDMFIGGDSLNGIARKLNADGRASILNGRWQARTVKCILSNPFYAGISRQQGVPDGHEAIVTQDVYNAAESRLRKLHRGRPSAKK